MKKKVAIVRALVMEPEILLTDEPFGALDEQTRIILGEELLRIQQQIGQTILFVTHNINEAAQLSDRGVAISLRTPASTIGEMIGKTIFFWFYG